MRRSTTLASVFVVLAAYLVLALAVTAGIAARPELAARDWLHRRLSPNPWPDDFVAVRIDAESQRTDARWPWPRDRQAALLRRLHELGARTILYDFYLAGTTDPDADREMQEALSATGAIAIIRRDARVRSDTDLEALRPHLLGVHAPGFVEPHTLVLPTAPFDTAAGGLAHVHVLPDADHVFRTTLPFLGVGRTGSALPSLAVLGLMRHDGVRPEHVGFAGTAFRFGGRRFPFSQEGRILLDPFRNEDRPDTLSTADVMSSHAERFRDRIEDKLVLVYVELSGKDYIPSTAGPRTAGGLFNAYAIRTLRGRAPRIVPPAGVLLALGVFLSITGPFVVRLSPRSITWMAAVAVPAYVFSTWLVAVTTWNLLPVVTPSALLALSGAGLALQSTRVLRRRLHDAEARADASRAPRGTVTLVFTDIQGSTALWENAPDPMREALAVHDAVLRRLLVEAGGYEVKTEGDAFMLAFTSPFSAVGWCLAVQKALLEAPWPPALLEREQASERHDGSGRLLWRGVRVRMGAHIAELEPAENPLTGRADYFGPPVNRAARVSSAAHGGQIVVSDAVWQALRFDRAALPAFRSRDLGVHALKGLLTPEHLHELVPEVLAARVFPPPNVVETSAPEFHLPRGGVR